MTVQTNKFFCDVSYVTISDDEGSSSSFPNLLHSRFHSSLSILNDAFFLSAYLHYVNSDCVVRDSVHRLRVI